jgi:ParB family chromosome partitioning protein
LNVVREVLAIPAEEIEPGERLRPVDPQWAGALAKLIERDGQTTPAEVCRLPGRSGFRLVVGGHRHAAVLSLGRPLEAVLGDSDALRRRSREVGENLFKRGLDPISRASFVAELIVLEKARAGLDAETDGRAASAEVRWAKAAKKQADDASEIFALAYGWAGEVAETVGLSTRAIYLDLQLFKGLAPDVAERLRLHPAGRNASALRAIAKLAPDAQRRAASLILEGRKPGEAIAILQGRVAPSPEAKAWSAFLGGWERMSKRRRVEGLRELERMGLPVGVKISFGGDA